MTIETKDWRYQVDPISGSDDMRVTVRGTVTVAHPGIKPTLVKGRKLRRDGSEPLDLKLEQEAGTFIQVKTDKEVCFEVIDIPGNQPKLVHVRILHERAEIATLFEVVKPD
ncbi:hypothetical protein [Pseudomonas sp. NUPR-001]|uniref:hypothetical protein n=1 Tax=Pseudomonas sp. NUPR-001 TaxID=3416058 RepID=UPI003F947ADB